MGDLLGLQAGVTTRGHPFLRGVADLVVVASSSRGGSTLVAEILRRLPGLLHFDGEINPFLVRAGLAYPASGTGSDRLDAAHAADSPKVQTLAKLLAEDCLLPADDLSEPLVRERFLARLTWRLGAQWPALTIPLGDVERALLDSLEQLGPSPEMSELHLRVLLALGRRHAGLSPYYYDLAPERVRELAPELAQPQGPPGDCIVEEPPFILVQPGRSPAPRELASMPVVLKTPSNAYRLEFLRALFPAARFRVLHLTRNAASSINGLIDGWSHHGFFSHDLPGRLAIPGYTDSQGPWAASWWKFDLPPGWERYARQPLPEVCAYQWLAAHEAALAFLDAHAVERRRVRFEDVLDPAKRPAVLSELALWLGVKLAPAEARRRFADLPVLMATQRPRNRRWLERGDLIQSVVSAAPIRRMMESLDYDERPETWL